MLSSSLTVIIIGIKVSEYLESILLFIF